MRQHSPLTTGAIEITDRVHDFPEVDRTLRSWSDTILKGQDQRFEKGPLLIRQIGRIQLPCTRVHVVSPCSGVDVTSHLVITIDSNGFRTASKIGDMVSR